MTHKEEIVKDVVAYLDGIDDAKTIAAHDFTEDRAANMIVVGINSIESVNFGLDDFKYEMSIIIDSFIDEDKDAATFDRVHLEVLDRLHDIFDDPKRYADVFPDLDRIVHFHFNHESATITERSNRVEIVIDIIGSFN